MGGRATRHRLDIEREAVRAQRHDTARVLREVLALRGVFEMHVAAGIAAAPGDHPDFRREPVKLRKERARSLRHIADMPGPRKSHRGKHAKGKTLPWQESPCVRVRAATANKKQPDRAKILLSCCG